MSNNEPYIKYLDLLDTEHADLSEQGIDPRSQRTRDAQIPFEQLESEVVSLHQEYTDLLKAQQIIRETQTLLDQLNIKAACLKGSTKELNTKFKLQETLLVELAANSLQPFTIAVRMFLVSLISAVASPKGQAVPGIALFSNNKTVATRSSLWCRCSKSGGML